jgi:hypothetical protein
MPIAPNGIAWRGRRACQCVIDATADYEKLVRSSLIGYIYQACYSFADASAGTHSKGGALDTVHLTDHGIRVASSIGFWPSNRFRWQGFPSDHCHWVLFGCPHMASGLAYQESELRAGRDGLAMRRKDIHAAQRPRPIRTYRQWKNLGKDTLTIGGKQYPNIAYVSAYWVNNRRKTGKMSRHVYIVQVWLRRLGYYKGPLDGRWGKVTQAAIDNFRRKHLGLTGADALGAVGLYSLSKLRDAAKSPRTVKEGR